MILKAPSGARLRSTPEGLRKTSSRTPAGRAELYFVNIPFVMSVSYLRASV